MIAKTIPAIYKPTSDPLFKKQGDTLYFNGQFYTGYQYSLYENGDSAFLFGFFNGVEEGGQRKYYPGNRLSEQRFYINGKKQGRHRSWWPDGKPKMDYTAFNNEYEGEFREWNSAGLLVKKFHYNQGIETGRQQLWWDNGTLRANYEVRNGRTYGLIGLKLCVNPNDSIKN
jgi:antitoxin component YwqK of YwqJK toxin-antitoxin module